MAYWHTYAADYADLLDQFCDFAEYSGWEIAYNELFEGEYKQIGLHTPHDEQDYISCCIAIGETPEEGTYNRGNGQFDFFLNAALSRQLQGASPYYWAGTAGSIVTSEQDPDRIRWNDLFGGFLHVWFFSGAEGDPYYLYIVARSQDEGPAGPTRYTHFGVGELDSMGQTFVKPCAFACGGVHHWWDDSSRCHNPAATEHSLGYLAESNAHVYIPPEGVLPPGFPAGGTSFRADLAMAQAMTRVNKDQDHWDSKTGKILDFYYPLGNQLITGGNSLYSIPWLFEGNPSAHNLIWLGCLPGIRVGNIAQHESEAELTIDGDTWMIFPWKKKGLKSNLSSGVQPIQTCNTAEYAWVFKKNVT